MLTAAQWEARKGECGGAGKKRGNFDIRKVRCYNCQDYGHFSRDCTKSRKEQAHPPIEWNIDNPNLHAGAAYQNMAELQNALTMYCIQSNNVYGTEKNEKGKLTIHCPHPRCRWKLHVTGMHGKKTIQIRYNNNPHTCAAKVETHKSKLATKNGLAQVMTPMLRKDPPIAATALGKTLSEIYGYEEKLRYMRLWTARMVALQNIKDQWDKVDTGFKLCPPVLTRQPCRPRVNRFRGVAEGGTVKRRKCDRCGELVDIGRVCSNAAPVGFGDNDAYQAAAAAATASALKAAKATAAVILASFITSNMGKTKQHWQPRSIEGRDTNL
ncbi:hypothetical protein D1007_05498 [Hordeum vulgare]|nr:hypothetical protein D1007_05498 [Hordeum vulgare]